MLFYCFVALFTASIFCGVACWRWNLGSALFLNLLVWGVFVGITGALITTFLKV